MTSGTLFLFARNIISGSMGKNITGTRKMEEDQLLCLEKKHSHTTICGHGGGCCESELKGMLKMSPKTHTKEGRWYKAWVKDRRISEVRNFIEKRYWPEMRMQKTDCYSWRDVVPEGAILSEIKYLDTAIERFYHKRLGGKT